MAKNKKIPILTAIGVVATAYDIYSTIREKGNDYAGYAITGYDQSAHKMDWGKVVSTYAPAIGGVVASKVASKVGLNRAMSGIPYVKA